MSEPTTHAIIIGTVAASIQAIGLDPALVLWGLVGGFWALSKGETLEHRWMYVSTVAGSSLFAAAFIPILLLVSKHTVHWGDELSKVAIPLAIFAGYFSHPILKMMVEFIADLKPVLIEKIRNFKFGSKEDN